jgi:hypothetical protein
VTWNVNVDPGYAAASWWGAAGYRAPSWQATSNLQQVRERQAQAVTRGAQQRLDIWQMIDARPRRSIAACCRSSARNSTTGDRGAEPRR